MITVTRLTFLKAINLITIISMVHSKNKVKMRLMKISS